MKNFIKVFCLSAIFLGMIGLGVSYKVANTDYDSRIGSYWSLGEKVSTIKDKAEQVNNFVTAIEGEKIQGSYDTIFFKTPNKSFNKNLMAIKSLDRRLHEISRMDEKSLEYQQAIMQIDGQEQGKSEELMSTINGCWMLNKHPLLYYNVAISIAIVLAVLFIIGVIYTNYSWYD